MLKETLSDKLTYVRVIRRMSRSRVMLPGARTPIRNPLNHVFTDSEALALRFPSCQTAAKRAWLPKWLAEEPAHRGGSARKARRGHRLVIAPAALNAVGMVLRLMRQGRFGFSRFRALAVSKNMETGLLGTGGRAATAPLGIYHHLSPEDRAGYRVMLKPTLPDTLVFGAMAEVLAKLFPKAYFLRECCGYIAGRGTKEAVRQVMARLRKGYRTILRLDVKSFNETVPQERLLPLILGRAAAAGWGEEDTALLERLMRNYFSRVDEALETPGTGIGMGIGLTPLLTNVYLHQLDTYIKGLGIPFCRFGDDVVLFFKARPQAERACADMTAFVEERLGQRTNERKVRIFELGPSQEGPAGTHGGFDFCAFHYGVDGMCRPVIRIKEATFEKIRRRIRWVTRTARQLSEEDEDHARHLMIGELLLNAHTLSLAQRIWRISALLGFPPKRVKAKSRVEACWAGVGWPPSFLNDASSEEIRRQFKELDRYILYRLGRFEKASGGDTGPESLFYKRMRDLGLRTFMDAWNRHPRPYRY